jgi:hypothetical protein
MTKFSTLAVIAAVAAAASALPSAQSFDPEAGSGNVLSFRYGPVVARNDTVAVRQANPGKAAARQNGLHAFAMVPRGGADGNSNDPALTGGGSAGYNQMLQQF